MKLPYVFILSLFLLFSITSEGGNPAARCVANPGIKLEPVTPDFVENPDFPLKNMTDSNPQSFALLGNLQDFEFYCEFNQVQNIPALACVQGGYGDWSHPKKLQLRFDDGSMIEWPLQLAPGELQILPLQRQSKTISVKIVERYQENRQTWGGLAEFGLLGFSPVTLNFRGKADPIDTIPPMKVESPLPKNTRQIELELEADADMTLPVQLKVAVSLTYDLPALEVRKGRHSYRLNLAQARERQRYGLDWYACHISQLLIGEKSLPHQLQLLNYQAVTDPSDPEPQWYEFAPFRPAKKQINGMEYTEGMSYFSVGRFANSTFNGLLTERTDDYYFQVSTFGPKADWRSQKFDFWLDGVDNISRTPVGDSEPWNLTRPATDGTDQVTTTWCGLNRTLTTSDGSELRWITSILAPGFLVSSNRDFKLSSRGGGVPPRRSGAPNEDERRFFLDGLRHGDTPQYPPSLLITPDGVIEGTATLDFSTLSEPWIVAVWGGMETPNWQGDQAIGVLLTADHGSIVYRQDSLKLAAGEYGVSTQFLGLFNPDWDLDRVRQRAALLCRMLRNYPVFATEYFRVEKQAVAIHNEFEYHKWGNAKWQAADYAPIPPIFSYGKEAFQQGDFQLDSNKRMVTFCGPYYWNDSATLDYRLPRFSAEYLIYPQVEAGRDWYGKLQKFYHNYPDGDMNMVFGGDAWLTPWRSFYWVQGIQGSTLVDTPTRQRLLRAGKFAVEQTLSATCWYPRRERYTQRQYLASLWVDDKVSPVIFGDINTGVGFSAYALYSYARISGDWKLVQELWSRQMDVLHYVELLNDWAVPLSSARENAHFSGIDMDTIVYAGLCAAEHMAEVINQPEDLERIISSRAKFGNAPALRLPFRDYFDATRQAPNQFVQGFGEDGPCLFRATLGNETWYNLAPTFLSWLGPQPEVFSFLNQMLGKEFMRHYHQRLWEECFTGENFDGYRKYNDWISSSTAVVLADRTTLDWPQEELMRDFNLYMEHFPWQAWQGTAWLIGALFGQADGIAISRWDPAALGAAKYDQSTKCLNLELTCPVAFPLVIQAPQPPRSLRVDGIDHPIRIRSLDSGFWELRIPVVSANVQLIW